MPLYANVRMFFHFRNLFKNMKVLEIFCYLFFMKILVIVSRNKKQNTRLRANFQKKISSFLLGKKQNKSELKQGFSWPLH